MERKHIHIMAIGAHIGDMELTAGGVLAKHYLLGDKVTLVHLTAGEKGNPPTKTVDEYRTQKIAEANKFAKMIGGEAIVLNYKDGELPDNDTVRFEVCDIIRKYKPDILITHWKNSMHKDHALTYKIVLDAQFYAGIKGFEREYPAHFAAGPYFAENWEDPYDFKPYVYVNISEGYDLWMKALKCHWFVTNSTSFKYLEYYDALSRVRGLQIRKERAEAFSVDPMAVRKVIDSF
ncbi:MAG TPA: PIG-L family deacetylase [Clostridiaceae bacterium]|nr:PIG-L family deacetylase [Clostridiaceae bacterium]